MSEREDQKLEIQQATDVVRLIGEQLALKPRGKEFVGLCPFHDDSKPSMYVSPAKQIYKCFSCGAGGDAYSFVMNYHKMTFPEALKYLADRAGVLLKPMRGGTSREGADAGGSGSGAVGVRELVGRANEVANGYFRAMLTDAGVGGVARAYLAGRRISDEMIEAFQIGYAPDRWDGLTEEVAGRRLDVVGFEKAGLIAARKGGGGYYDRFRGRVVFPILDELGRAIAFGARQLAAEDEPKYLNSPETPVFRKSATLYGLHLAKRAIIKTKTAIVMEGYTDVVACHQGGVCNTVATLGTALTREHVQVLSRLCEKVVLVFDADAAGEKAADRALEVFLRGGVDVAVAVLPAGVDPADMVTGAGGAKALIGVVDQAADALEYKLGRLQDQLGRAGTMAARERLSQQYIGELGALGLGKQGVIRDAVLIQRVGQLLRIDEGQVRRLLIEADRVNRGRAGVGQGAEVPVTRRGEAWPEESDNISGRGVAGRDGGPRISAQRAAEQQVIGCLVRQPGLFHSPLSDGRNFDEAMPPAEMSDPVGRSVYQVIYEKLSEGRAVSLAGLLAEFADRDGGQMAVYLTEVESAVECCTDGSSERLAEVWGGATDTLLRVQWQTDFDRRREAVIGSGQDGDADMDKLMRQVAEHRRGNPSPVRIVRSSFGS